jgi:membrane protein YqaA with SNARE-associated domain
MQINKPTENNFLKKYVFQKIFWSIIALLLVVIINILINKYAGNYFNEFAQKVSENYILTGFSFFISEIVFGIFPAELFMMIYQSKVAKDYFLIVFVLGIISSLCGFIAFLGGKYLKSAKLASMILFQKKFKEYGDLFIKYGWVILILAATTPLPFAIVCFIAGYFKFSPVTFLKIVVPVRIVRFFISAFFIKYSMNLI